MGEVSMIFDPAGDAAERAAQTAPGAVIADSPEALTSERQGDLVKVRIGAAEGFDVVDAFLSGG